MPKLLLYRGRKGTMEEGDEYVILTENDELDEGNEGEYGGGSNYEPAKVVRFAVLSGDLSAFPTDRELIEG